MRLIDADKLDYTCNADECGMLTGCNHCQYNIITEDEIDSAPTVEAIPKADYENRLKADMVAMFTEIQLEIKELWDSRYDVWLDNQYYIGKSDTLEEVDDIIQQKIDSLKAREND